MISLCHLFLRWNQPNSLSHSLCIVYRHPDHPAGSPLDLIQHGNIVLHWDSKTGLISTTINVKTYLSREHVLSVIQRTADFQNFISRALLFLSWTSLQHSSPQFHPGITICAQPAHKKKKRCLYVHIHIYTYTYMYIYIHTIF